MIKTLTSSLLFTTFYFGTLFAQELDPNCEMPNKKAQKLVDAGNKAANGQEAAKSFAEAIKEQPDNAGIYFQFGMYMFDLGSKNYESSPNPATGDANFKKAEALLEKAFELCDNYHSDILYTLGVINFTQEDKETALAWFKKFLDFKNSDNTRYGTTYSSQLTDVKQLLKVTKDEQETLSKEVPYSPQLVKNVSSTETDEYFPMISPDNLFMFFTRKKNIDNGGVVNVIAEVYTYSKREDENLTFDAGTDFPSPFNKGDFQSYGAASVSVDNKEMVICACKKTEFQGQPYMNCDLYSTTFEKIGPNPRDYQWSELVSLGAKINSPNAWEGQPSMSADGQTLYYVVNGPKTRDNDVFVVKRNEDGSWGIPRSFDEINTEGKDKSPFLHQDSETMYFVSTCSDKRKGVGGTDIFYMREENGVWSAPINIGYPINSKEDELGLFVSTDGKLAYFSSRYGGNWNIYGFELYAEARPKSVTILKGELKEPNGGPVENATIEIAYENTGVVEKVKVNGNDGKYAVVVKTETPQDIIVSVKKEGAAFESKLITKEEIAVKEKRNDNNLQVKELKVGDAYTINDVLYAYNSDVLTDRSKFILKEFARYLNEHEAMTFVIQGHTDSDGDDAKNLDLSDRRAKGVKEYLVSLGVTESRLEAKGFGETSPKAENTSAENKAKNRRTDFMITGL